MAKQVNSGFILPDSNALKQLQENIAYNEKMGLLNVKAKTDYENKINKDFMDNQLKVKSGVLFQDDLNAATQSWINKGAELRAQGINPFSPNINDPEQLRISRDFLKQKQDIEGMADTRDVYQKNFLDAQNQYAKGEVDENSWGAFNDFYKSNKLPELYAGGITPPSLVKRFNEGLFMKDIKTPVHKENEIKGNIETTTVGADVEATRRLAEAALNRNPQAQRQYGISPDTAPIKMFVGTTDPSKVASVVNDYYSTTPEGAKEIVKLFPSGTVPSTSSPEYQKILKDQTEKQLKFETKREGVVDNIVKTKVSEVGTSEMIKYNSWVADQKRKNADHAMKVTRFNERNNVKGNDGGLTYRKDLVERILNQVPGSGEDLNAVMNARRGYQGGLDIGILGNGRISIKVPKRVVGDKVTDTRTLVFDKNKKEDRLKLNTFINEIAGENISTSKFVAGKASGILPTKKTTAPTASPSKQTTPPTTKFKGVPKGGF